MIEIALASVVVVDAGLPGAWGHTLIAIREPDRRPPGSSLTPSALRPPGGPIVAAETASLRVAQAGSAP